MAKFIELLEDYTDYSCPSCCSLWWMYSLRTNEIVQGQQGRKQVTQFSSTCSTVLGIFKSSIALPVLCRTLCMALGGGEPRFPEICRSLIQESWTTSSGSPNSKAIQFTFNQNPSCDKGGAPGILCSCSAKSAWDGWWYGDDIRWWWWCFFQNLEHNNSMWEVTLPNFQWIWKARNWQTGIQAFTTNRGNCMTDWILQMEQLGSWTKSLKCRRVQTQAPCKSDTRPLLVRLWAHQKAVRPFLSDLCLSIQPPCNVSPRHPDEHHTCKLNVFWVSECLRLSIWMS